MAGSGNSFSSDPVHLVEGVWPQVPVICCSYEHLQVNRLLTVSHELRQDKDSKTECRSKNKVQIIDAKTLPKSSIYVCICGYKVNSNFVVLNQFYDQCLFQEQKKQQKRVKKNLKHKTSEKTKQKHPPKKQMY